MKRIDLETLLSATSAGGPSALSSITPLRPAGGPMAAIAPAKYAAGSGSVGTYVFSTRYVNGEPQKTVLIDSSQSQTNRVEQALAQQIADGNPVLARIPRIRVTYHIEDQVEQYCDLELPHRAWDGHIRAGTAHGEPVTADDTYRAARNASPANAWALMNLSPISMVFGSWDATRKSHQGRWAAALTGETIGVLTDQHLSPTWTGKGGARIDPVGMRFELSKAAKQQIADRQKEELSKQTYEAFLKADASKTSVLGLGGIPPTLAQLGLVSCAEIVRSRVLSFATLRQIRFGQGPVADAALRAVLAAIAINGVVRADAELFLRAHCHLVESGPTMTEIDLRHGQTEALELPEVGQVDELLEEAMDHATRVAGLNWSGQVFEVEGNPAILEASVDETDGN